MAFIKVKDFNAAITSKQPSPVYLFAGEESYLINSCFKKLSAKLAVDDLNREIFYASESSAEDILNAVQTLPFLNERRAVVVKDVSKMKPSDAERINDYLSNTVDTSCLILLYNENYKKESVAKRKALINECISSKDCIAVDCRRLYESEVRDFIKSEFSSRGKNVSYEVISGILEENGTDLMNISNEIDKLCLFTGKNKKNITVDDLGMIGGYTKETNVYTLSSEIEAKNIKKALLILERLLSEGEEGIIILSALSSSVRRLLNAKSMIEEHGMSDTEAAASLRIHNYFAKAFFANLKKHSMQNLKVALKTVLKSDIAIKTGSCDTASALEKIVLSVCR